jgi:hypothetical protein
MGIFRVRLVQTALSAIVVRMTSTLSGLVVLAIALPLLAFGTLVTQQHAMFLPRESRSRMAAVGWWRSAP